MNRIDNVGNRIDNVGVAAALVLVAVLAGAFFSRGHAQQNGAPASGVQRILIAKGDVSVPGREADAMRAEIAPGGSTGRHTHPGDEISYVVEGESTLLIDGQPPRRVKAGESFVIPAGVVHDAHNDTDKPVKLVGVYVVEKGKPLASPAP